MQKLLINGKKELSGKISISGSKNATLPILAATILSDQVKLKNVPLVKDIFTMVDLLKFIGLKINILKKKKTIEINNINKNIKTLAPYKLVKTMRAGVLVLGPLLAKYKKAKISLPGGCAIGTRPVNLHLLALKKLGAKIKIKNGYIFAEAKNGLKGAKITFPSISVGATENAVLAAFNAKGKTILKNCAIEPEVKDLIKFLNMLGGRIKIVGRKILIIGCKIKKKNITHEVIFDRIELGTYMIAAALVGKKIIFDKINPNVWIRIKANLTVKTDEVRVGAFHLDFPTIEHTTSIYYINSNDGCTTFENGEEIQSVENTLVTFPSRLRHAGSTPSSTKIRCVLNLNYHPYPW